MSVDRSGINSSLFPDTVYIASVASNTVASSKLTPNHMNAKRQSTGMRGRNFANASSLRPPESSNENPFLCMSENVSTFESVKGTTKKYSSHLGATEPDQSPARKKVPVKSSLNSGIEGKGHFAYSAYDNPGIRSVKGSEGLSDAQAEENTVATTGMAANNSSMKKSS